MKYNFTLIIPTHNRHNYLTRSIAYFKHLAAKVIYCDSSEEEYIDYLAPNMEYLHLPGRQFAEKILIALEKIKTDFVALCADDDFIIIDSLYKANDFLMNENVFKTVLGKNIFFHENFDGWFYSDGSSLPEDVYYNPLENASIFFKNYRQILWGIYSKDILRRSFEIIKDAKFNNDNFIELTLGAISSFYGGIKFLNVIWSVRELSLKEHWGDRYESITKYYQNRHIRDDFKIYKRLIDTATFDGLADIVLSSYLNLNNIKKLELITKSKLKEIMPKFLLRRIIPSNNNLTPSNTFEKYSSVKKIHVISNPHLALIQELVSVENE